MYASIRSDGISVGVVEDRRVDVADDEAREREPHEHSDCHTGGGARERRP